MTSKTVFQYQRGDMYLVEEHQTQGHEQKKTRPWVLVSASVINSARGTVVAVPLSTSAPEKPPISLKVYVNNTVACVVLDQIRALDKRRLMRFEGSISSHEMDLIDDGLRTVLAL